LQSAAQQRLRVLGVPSGSGRGGGVTMSSPQTGVVSEVLVREGQAVMPGTPLFRVNGTDTLWLEAAIPQAGAAGIGPGTAVQATINAIPGEMFEGHVETLLPQIDPTSRTQRARIVLRNEHGTLVPGMFAELTLQVAEGAAVPLVPTEALIATGSDSRVIVVGGDGRFQPVRVRVGRSSGGRTEILAGLKGGERVVTSGQFLIDSEASLSGALQRLGALPSEMGEVGTEQPPVSSFPRKRGFQRTDVRSSMDVKPNGEQHQEYERREERKAKSLDDQPSAVVERYRLRGNDEQKPRQCPVSYWYDPMVPDKHFDKPGKSPFMDMQLVPKFAPGAAPDCTVRDVETVGQEAKP
ncbi:MAG: efflux RND transporter periplasmic adaptor subunit, partial [Lysobacter sp.]